MIVAIQLSKQVQADEEPGDEIVAAGRQPQAAAS
jgi:hypothetical protein